MGHPVFNNTKGDLSKLNEVWSFEENLNVVENIDKIDKIDRNVIVQNSSFLFETSDCEVKTESEIVDSSSVRTEQEVGENSRNKKLENSSRLLHNQVEIIRSTLNVDKIVDEDKISKIEKTFEINQTYYGANVDRSNKTCIDVLKNIPVNLLDTLYLQDKLDYIEAQLKHKTEDEVNKILLLKYEKDRQCIFIQLRNLPAVLRRLSSVKEEAWKLLENIVKLKPIVALSLVARAKYPSHAPHRFHYGNRKSFLRFKKIVENSIPGIQIIDPKTI